MGYRERIEKAIVVMFNLDRKRNAKFQECGYLTKALQDELDIEDCCHIALDLLGIPKDNTLDYDYNNPELKGEWPKGAFCRDSYCDMWMRDIDSGEEFIDYCYKTLKYFAEKGETFTKPRSQ